MSNRTREFFQIIETYNLNNQPLLQIQESQFSKASKMISNQLRGMNLLELHNLSMNKSLFIDKTTEINDLIAKLRQEMTLIKQNIQKLQQHLQQLKLNKQQLEHCNLVVMLLNTKLGDKSSEFTRILKIRSENLKEQQSRKELYIDTEQQQIQHRKQPSNKPGSSYTNQQSSFTSYNQPSNSSNDQTVLDFGYYEQELAQNSQNSSYMDQRSQTITQIEQTIAEIGQIYSNFSNILAQQREKVQRIDDNTLDTLGNVEGAHGEILRYYENMGNNRGLVLKTFGVVVTFFMVFVLMT